MNIRQKTLVLIGLTLLLSMGALFATSKHILGRGFTDLEERQAREHLERVLAAIQEDIDVLNRFTIDWAAWDDTYAFVRKRSDAYVTSNLVDSTFIDNGLSIILFVDRSARIVWGNAMDLEKEKLVPPPSSLLERFGPASPLLAAEDEDAAPRGLLVLPEGVLLFSAQPILTSDSEGPPRGTLFMARAFDDAAVEHLGQRLRLDLSALPAAPAGDLPHEFRDALSHLNGPSKLFTMPRDENVLSGFARVEDALGGPGVILHARIPRIVYAQGARTTRYVLVAALMIGLFVAVGILAILEKNVLARLSRLTRSVVNIRKGEKLSARLPAEGSDEISVLSSQINTMLEAIEKSTRARYRELFENASDPIFVVNDEARYIDVNRRAMELFGFSREELLSMSIFDMIPEDQVPRSRQAFERLRTAGVYENFVGRMRTKNGGWRDIEVNAAAVYEDGRFAGSRDIVRDITARRQAEEALRESEERFRTIFEESHEAFVLINPEDATLVDMNTAARRLLGSDSAHSRGEPITSYIGNDAWQACCEHASPLQQNSSGRQLEQITLRNADARKRIVSIQSQIHRIGGRTLRLLVLRDRTETLALEKKWRASLQRLLESEKMAFVGTMVSGVAHDINNPNQLIRGNLYILNMLWKAVAEELDASGQVPAHRELAGIPVAQWRKKVPQALDDMEQGSERIAAMVKNLLRHVRGHHGEPTEEVDLNAVVKSASALLRHRIKESGAVLRTTAGPDLPRFSGNRQHMEQVVINLILNALEALENRPGHVEVETQSDNDGTEVVLSVRDDGAGMTSEQIAKIKTPFFTTKDRAGGTGLGVTICETFVASHQGTLEFRSEPGRGTTATVRIPVTVRKSSPTGDLRA